MAMNSKADHTATSPPSGLVVPGDFLGFSSSFSAGPGVRSYFNSADSASAAACSSLFASRVGQVRTSDIPIDGKTQISIEPTAILPPVPKPGDLVTGRVLKVTARHAVCELLLINYRLSASSSLSFPVHFPSPFPALIRHRDVRSFDIESVRLLDSFRPGDLVRALVISLGDSRHYYLSTAENELGVIAAYSLADPGIPLLPVSWELMECPLTASRESRKVARPDTEGQLLEKIRNKKTNFLTNKNIENAEELDETEI